MIFVVGEANPYGLDPRFALFDLPKQAAGYRLRTRIFRVTRRTYFTMQRCNLCIQKWDAVEAAAKAAALMRDYPDATFIVLGRKVATAFGLDAVDFFSYVGQFLVLPHPSGLCRVWNEPFAFDRAQALLKEVLPAIPWGEI